MFVSKGPSRPRLIKLIVSVLLHSRTMQATIFKGSMDLLLLSSTKCEMCNTELMDLFFFSL